MNSRYRERKYNTSDNDRLLRALSQPVQAWDKKWTQQSKSKTLQTFKWVKSDRVIEFEQEEESEEEPEPMETDGSNAVAATTTAADGAIGDATANSNATTVANTTTDATAATEPATITTTTATTQTTVETKDGQETTTTTTTVSANATANTDSAQNQDASLNQVKALDESVIPGGPSSIISNKAVSSLVEEEDDDERRSQTPKLDDISDEEDQNANNDDNDVDSINDASKHPALAPHAQAHMTDDDMTDSSVATPQTTTEGNTPMPLLEDEPMEEASNSTNNLPHPLSQEILSNTGALGNNDNDSPAIQTPEDPVTTQHEAMEEH